MFAGIGMNSSQSIEEGIKSAALIPEGLIAEKGQVMVIVPGERAKKAETSLAALQSTLVWAFVAFLIIVVAYIYFFWFKKPVEYQGRALPAIGTIDDADAPKPGTAQTGSAHLGSPKKTMVKQESRKIQLDNFVQKNHYEDSDEVPSAPSQDDIIRVVPPFPVYSNYDHEEVPDNEKKVSDTDADIIKKMKARDDFMKDIEKSHSK